jgi:hypothetical protein
MLGLLASGRAGNNLSKHWGGIECYLKAEVAFSYVVRGQADFAGGGTQPVSRGAAAGRAAEQRDAMSGEKVSTVAKAVEMLEAAGGI